VENAFVLYLQAGIFGSVIILLVVLLRLCLRKAPRQLVCILWLLAAVRLLLPFDIESNLSLQPQFLSFSNHASGKPEVPDAPQQTPVIPDVQPDTVPEQTPVTPDVELEDAPAEQDPVILTPSPEPVTLRQMLPVLWICGGVGVLGWAAVAYLRLARKIRFAVKDERGAMVCDGISGAFVLGYFRPRIYLPAALEEAERKYILAHEQAHIARGDHWWKLLGLLCVSLHWYNPLVWIAYLLLRRDMEVACDERVVWSMELWERKEYSSALLSCGRRMSGLTAAALCFGKESLKKRIQNVLSFRKPGIWITMAAGMLVVFVAICFLTAPQTETPAATEAPTVAPTVEPTQAPTQIPTVEPTQPPATDPTQEPMIESTQPPTVEPTQAPTQPPVVGSGKCGEDLTWQLQNGTLTISGSGAMADYSDADAQPWQAYRKTITSLTIGSGVTKIGDYAFSKCTALHSVKIPANVETIGRYAFGGCTNLVNVAFADNGKLHTIGRIAFADSGITEFVAPASLRTIQRQAFTGCKALKKVVLEGGVQTVEIWAFENCTGLKILVLGQSITSIDSITAFDGCNAIEYYELYTDAYNNHCLDCETSLKTAIVGGNCSYASGFSRYTALSSVKIEYAAFVGNGAFERCESLKDITIPESVQRIYASAFSKSGITQITFLGDAPEMTDSIFIDITATVYYPANNPTWTEEVRQDYGGTITWIAV